jgi:hypothetical protein
MQSELEKGLWRVIVMRNNSWSLILPPNGVGETGEQLNLALVVLRNCWGFFYLRLKMKSKETEVQVPKRFVIQRSPYYGYDIDSEFLNTLYAANLYEDAGALVKVIKASPLYKERVIARKREELAKAELAASKAKDALIQALE